jgi:hypothetical protein
MATNLFKRFGESLESPPLHQWYELANGEKVDCDEETIHILWCNWITNTNDNSIRADTDDYTVFEFKEPIDLDLETAERWDMFENYKD